MANPLECGGDGGCSGGTPQLAFSSLVGMASEWSYSYTSFHGNVSACKYDPSKTPPIARVSGYVQIPLNDQDALMEALVTMGPVSVNLVRRERVSRCFRTNKMLFLDALHAVSGRVGVAHLLLRRVRRLRHDAHVGREPRCAAGRIRHRRGHG